MRGLALDFVLESTSGRLAVRDEQVWRVEHALLLRALPRANAWCAGWVWVQGHAVPVYLWGESLEPGENALVVVSHRDHLLGLPCSAVSLLAGRREKGEAVVQGLPCSGRWVAEEGGEVPEVDLDRLFQALGIAERSGYTTLEG